MWRPKSTLRCGVLAEVGTAGVVSLADLAEVVTAGVASLADIAGVVTDGVASSADLAGDVTAGAASSADLAVVTTLRSPPSVWRPRPNLANGPAIFPMYHPKGIKVHIRDSSVTHDHLSLVRIDHHHNHHTIKKTN